MGRRNCVEINRRNVVEEASLVQDAASYEIFVIDSIA